MNLPCIQCPERQRPCAGPCLCLVDQRDILEHARAGECPKGYFTFSAEELAELFPKATPQHGPGSELEAMFHLIVDHECCSSCGLRAAQMNAWGIAGCREHRDEIISWLTEAAKERGWLAIIAAGANAVKHGLPLTIGGMVDEAIRRAAEKESAANSST